MKILGLFVLIVCSFFTGCHYPLLNIQNSTIPQREGHVLSLEEVKAAIMKGQGIQGFVTSCKMLSQG